MPDLKLTLETVTPLFLGGAEPRGTKEQPAKPELRPPSVRGAIRYWLRAALGGVIGDSNPEALHKLESAVFGSTDFGSPIQLRLQGNLKFSSQKILPHKEAGKRNAFDAGQAFKLMMRQLRTNDEPIWHAACSALALTLIFGGIGLRSRRGYGTLRIVKSSEPAIIPPMPHTLDAWGKYIEQTTTNVLQAMRDLAIAQKVRVADLPKGPTHYPCANQSGMIRICDLKANDAMDAVTHFMTNSRNDPAFGGIGRGQRQASPLWMRPIPIGDKYGLLLIVLASTFDGSDYQRVRAFVESFKGQSISVKGWNA
jgi:CRISPR-associated protein Cmr1